MTINERVSPKKPLFAEVHNVPDDYRFTTEELDRIISGDMFTPRQDAIMARELQQYRAAAKPACYALTNSAGEVYNTHSSPENADAYRWLIHQSDDSLTLSVTPLYTAPQVTSVHPAKNLELAGWQFKSVNGDWLGLIGEHGKNQAVREGCVVREVFAMVDGINDREQVRREHAAWSESTFGNVGPIGPLKHLSKEALEAAASPEDLSEWADMQFLLWDAQRRAGITDEQITQAMVEKLAVNEQREWPEPKDGEPRLHIAAPAVQAEQPGNTEPVRLAYMLPFDQWLSQQTGKIDVDCGCVTTEAFFHWMRTAYDAGNYPGWIPVSDRLPEAAITVLISNGADIGKAYWLDEWGYDFAGDKVPGDVTHWMPLPNPPKQEAE